MLQRLLFTTSTKPQASFRAGCRSRLQHLLSSSTPLSSPSLFQGQQQISHFSAGPGDAPPFEKIMVANRGEIVERVIKTARKYGVKTVAVHSIADTKARFVELADEAVCIGPAAASESYLNVPRLLQAMKETGAQAVHPGYGFLSENANFSKIIEENGAVFLGPTAHAIHKLGDKLESKLLAVKSGVNIVPGYDKPVESLEQALQLCNETIGYPVLMKAAAGGGGKGMRTCYNDQDVKEGWKIAKSEALKFFSDDRILIEKYIVNPHHIEFQVMANPKPNGDTDVVVFPERECSIQRRNQKVIEETPSCLLLPETRLAMAEQARALCKTVSYRSAGTIEFLVDENQGFYFLEMNTRLQVEHPVTEAVTGVDLVKAMLWIGAGRGLPEELQPYTSGIMPPCGHAIEARIYAEDPLRGFLPSTGPLTTYVEPSTTNNSNAAYVRCDSGVRQGHVVVPYYDPMLSKLIYYAGDRPKAIAGLCRALDEYVIEGVQHNARMVQSVLRHPFFLKGDTPTSFLPRHFPKGFTGVELSDAEKEEFAVSAALIMAFRKVLLQQPDLASSNGDDEGVIVRLGGMFGTAYKVILNEDSATVQRLDVEKIEPGRTVKLDASIKTEFGDMSSVEYNPAKSAADVSVDGKVRTIQVLKEAVTGDIKMQMYGCDINILIQSPREYELTKHMHKPVPRDMSSMVLSPMPGALISFAVKEGDQVQPGQELCIVEAMKMQNIIRAPRLATVESLKVKVGSSLKSDQVILTFVKDEATK